MPQRNIEITPSVTVYTLLDIYPQLEDVLIGMAPVFKKLRNPILRKSIARVATLKQVSAVGGISLDNLIRDLREAVGQPVSSELYTDQDYFEERPEWYIPEQVALSIDEANLENKDSMALVTVLSEARNITKGEIIELVTTFLPAPAIDIMKSKGYSVWCRKAEGDMVNTYFLKNTD